MIKAHKIALIPNNCQRTFFAQSAGTARFAYNWALNRWQKLYESGEKTSEQDLRRELNAIKLEAFSIDCRYGLL
ncbi:MAG: helix-turn-helix domain-containing protein [Oligoflexales bacterium]